ncbi:hypothetical protein HHI36_021374 [Cryptolaemus montrouzieri]|uniref:CCHC-type domain-containing protein n=1 Tax=Cryptolaemus montrouzieri TaxID=559131 RepID=A0ABD2MWW0_9CUCU
MECFPCKHTGHIASNCPNPPYTQETHQSQRSGSSSSIKEIVKSSTTKTDNILSQPPSIQQPGQIPTRQVLVSHQTAQKLFPKLLKCHPLENLQQLQRIPNEKGRNRKLTAPHRNTSQKPVGMISKKHLPNVTSLPSSIRPSVTRTHIKKH